MKLTSIIGIILINLVLQELFSLGTIIVQYISKSDVKDRIDSRKQYSVDLKKTDEYVSKKQIGMQSFSLGITLGAVLLILICCYYTNIKNDIIVYVLSINSIVLKEFLLEHRRLGNIATGTSIIMLVLFLSYITCSQMPSLSNYSFFLSVGVCVFLFYLLMDIIVHIILNRIDIRVILFLALLGAVSFFIIIFLLRQGSRYGYSPSLILCMIGLLVIDRIVLYLINIMNQKNRMEAELIQSQQRLALQEKYMNNIIEIDNQNKKFRHDMNNHFKTLGALIQNSSHADEMKQAKDYLFKYQQQYMKVHDVVHTDNDVINALLNTKLAFCKENGIQVTTSVTQQISTLEDIDVCSLIGNLFDNAIEAVLKLSDADKRIAISIEQDNDILNIFIKNTIDHSILNKKNWNLTDKKEKEKHGYGIKIISDLVHKYNGDIDYYEEGHYFCCNIII